MITLTLSWTNIECILFSLRRWYTVLLNLRCAVTKTYLYEGFMVCDKPFILGGASNEYAKITFGNTLHCISLNNSLIKPGLYEQI